jgi:hypothetical protein
VQDQRHHVALKDSVLVLDQDIEKLFDAQLARQLRAKLVLYVKELGVKIYVKPHPGQNRSVFAQEFGENVVSIETLKPAELVALELRPRYLVSFISSALKNVRGILPDVKAYSFGAREFDEMRGMHLAKVFHDFGVTVL